MMLEENNRSAFKISDSDKDRLFAVIEQEYANICGIVIAKAGETVCRQSFHGYDMTTPVHVASLTKSILSALVGIAAEQGYIKSLNQKVMEFFPEYEFSEPNVIREAATLKDLLSMTVPYSFPDFMEPLEAFSMSPDWVRFALEMMDGKGRMGDFKYSTEGAHLLSAILTKAAGKSALAFANEFLFAPAGMSVIDPHPLAASEMNFDTLFGKDIRGWANDPQGFTTGGWGLTMTPDDMAVFGQLYLSNGIRNGVQIIPKDWVTASAASNQNHYSYMWWQLEFGSTHAFAAMGDGGNIICCIPEKHLVIAIASSFMMNPKDRCILIGEHILPLFD